MYTPNRPATNCDVAQNFWLRGLSNIRSVVLTALVFSVCIPSTSAAIIEVPGDQPSVQAAIDVAVSGDTIFLDINSSPFPEGIITIPVSKPNLTILGNGSTINSSSINFGLDIQADDVVIEDLTIDGAGTFGFITGDPAVGGNGLMLTNCTAQNCGGTGFAITGVDNIILTDLTSTDNGGNGMSLTSVQDVTVTNYTSSGNTFGTFGAGIGIFSCDDYTPCEADSITITGIIDIAESPQIYSQEDGCTGSTCGSGSVSNIILNPSNISYTHFLGITQQQKFYYTALDSAFAAADELLLADVTLRPLVFVEAVVSGNKHIGPRSMATEDLSIQAAIDYAMNDDTVYFEPGTVVEGSQIMVDKNMTFLGSGKTLTTLRPGFDTGTSGDARGWFLVNDGIEANFISLTLDGLGNLIWQGIRHKGSGLVDSVLFTNIQYNAAGPDYRGSAMNVIGSGNVDVTNSMFTEIGRNGVVYLGTGITGSFFRNNIYTGKGPGDWLDYALDIRNGAVVTVEDNIITENRGVRPGSDISAGIFVGTPLAVGTTVTITGNDITDNYFGIQVGLDPTDQSIVSARNNNITGNRIGISSMNAQVDGILNWWGSADGPDEVGPGSGDSVTVNVTFCPWLTAPYTGTPIGLDPVVITCPSNMTLDCGQSPHPRIAGFPTATGPLSFNYTYDDTVIYNPSGPIFYTIFREWIVENTCGEMDTCVQNIFIDDRRPPLMVNCPADVYIDLSDNLQCDTTVYLVPPSARDNCVFLDFSGPFDEGFWELDHTGGDGTNGTALFSPYDNVLTMRGSDDGTTVTSTDLCITIPHDGELAFDWTAESEFGTAPGIHDRAALVVDGFVMTLLGMTGTISDLEMEEGDIFCFRVNSDQVGSETTLEVSSLVFTPSADVTQISGPVLDNAPGSGTGDDLVPGVYEVVWEGIDFAGNTAQCTTEIVIAGADNMSCKDIHVSLDQNCGVRVNAEMVLTDDYVCLDFLVVELFEHGVPIGDSIDLSHLGKTLEYTVTDPGSGNSCWGTILVEDKYPPQFVCDDITTNCIQFQYQVDTPDVIDFCQDVTVKLVSEQVHNRDCDQRFIKLINRHWVAYDASGNVSDTCRQNIWIERFPFGQIVPPVQDTTLYCGAGYDTTANGYPSPLDVDVPRLDTFDLFPLPDFFCNVLVEFEDHLMGQSACTTRFLRQWKVTEWWCNEDSVRRFDQIITIVDTVGPAINIGFDSIYAKAGQRGCFAWVELPQAVVSDACHGVDRVDMDYPGGFAGNQNGGRVRLPVGYDTVVYRAYDDCYNLSTDTLIVHVQDQVAPVAICDQNTTVTLNIYGEATVLADAFDDGSFDECEVDSFSVRRMDDVCGAGSDQWGPSVDFCCEDVDTIVMVAFRVTDISGNENTCMVRVQVQDKQPPRVIGLPHIRIDCRFDWDTANLDVFGKFVFDPADRDSIKPDADFLVFIGDPLDGLVIDNCPPVVEETVDMSNLDQCGIGALIRLFTFTDDAGNQATYAQSIFFENNNKFTEAQIDWPDHIDTANVCGVDQFNPLLLADSLAFPRFMGEDECSMIGYDYKDEVIDASQGNEACFKIIRHWTVIDWCQSAADTTKKWFHDQVIEVRNTIAPTILNDCMDTVRCVVNNTCMPDTFALIGLANDDCTDSLDLFWRIKIDEFNDGTIDHVILSNDATGLYPFGVHKAKYIVEDLCGNQDSCEFLFELRNCKPPTAYCVNGLIAELTPLDTGGMPGFDIEIDTIFARDFDDGSSHVCDHPLVFSFSSNIMDTVRLYTCDSLDPARRDVTVWVTDTLTGQVSKCVNFVTVQDNNMIDVCDTMTLNGRVSGLIATVNNKMVDEAAVYMEQPHQRMDMTDRQGAYTFEHVGYGSDFMIMPTKAGDYNNGVSTADLVAIQRHLLGIRTFDNPYLYIAADVNNTGNVSSADIAELRKVILGIRNDFPRNESWRFVDQAYQFPNPHNPWEEVFPETYVVKDLQSDMNVDFVGVKIGDVTGDVELGGFRENNDTRSDFVVHVDDQIYEAGQEVTAKLIVSNLEDLGGCQFTLQWAEHELELLEILPNPVIDMSKANFGMHRVDEGLLSMSWHTSTTWQFPSDKQKFLCVIRFVAKNAGRLSQAGLTISEAITANESYDKVGRLNGQMRLSVGNNLQESPFALYQNVPNPWSESTTIGFTLPQADAAKLSVFDENGRLVWNQANHYEAGYHEVKLSTELFRAGVYFYRLESRNHTAMRKMLIIQ